MEKSDQVFAGSIPEIYERFLVPLIFEPYAADLATRIAAAAPREVLETAAGTGVLTRALVSRLAPSTRIVATDLNQPMLDQAAKRGAGGRVEWRQADALDLPFADRSFDVVACQFGVMFFPDKTQGFRQARRVLRPAGRFQFNVWDRIEENEFADVVTQTLAELFPDDPPRFMARTPHGHHDGGRLRQDLAAAGFTDVAIEAVDARSRAPSARQVAVAYCQGTPLRSEIEARDAGRLAEATDRSEAALSKRYGSGAVDGRIRAFVVSAAV
jgi:ubiquinone/menaquinone biosynthesis C-methylase UbiE